MDKADRNKNSAWFDSKEKQLKVVAVVFQKYFRRMESELDEVKIFFEQHQQKLKLEQASQHKSHASEAIICSICSACISRTNLARHKKTHS
jgi:hypothetical protein